MHYFSQSLFSCGSIKDDDCERILCILLFEGLCLFLPITLQPSIHGDDSCQVPVLFE